MPPAPSSYIIKESGLSICAASKHLQTRRFLDTLQAVLVDLQRMIVQLYVEANKSPKTVATPVIPSLTRVAAEAGLANGGSAAKKPTVLVKGGRRLNGLDEIDEAELLQAAAEETLDGYGYFELPVEETRRERHKRIGASGASSSLNSRSDLECLPLLSQASPFRRPTITKGQPVPHCPQSPPICSPAFLYALPGAVRRLARASRGVAKES